MSGTACFFLPWHVGFVKGRDYNMINSKKQHCYKDDNYKIVDTENIKWWRKPYFAILNERGTVKFFLDALLKKTDGHNLEAKVYLSRYYNEESIERTINIFDGVCDYEYVKGSSKQNNNEVTTITIIPKYISEGRHQKLIHISMISEPDRYGKWKIYNIVEDHNERKWGLNI